MLLCLVAPAWWARAEASEPIPVQTGLLVDRVGKDALDAAARDALEARLQAIQGSGRAQVAIPLSGGTGGEPLAEYSLRVAEAWQVGRAKHDDGLLLVVIPSAPAVRLEVGYGLEGDLPDARASRWGASCWPP